MKNLFSICIYSIKFKKKFADITISKNSMIDEKAVVERCSMKSVLLKIFQDSQKNPDMSESLF